MNSSRRSIWLRSAIVVLFLLIPLAGTTAALQGIPPETSQAQVVAQGIQTLDDSKVRWQVQSVMAGPDAPGTSPSMSFGGFVHASGDDLIVHRDYADFRLISHGESTWTPYGEPTQVITVGQEQTRFTNIALQPHSEPQAGESFDPFSIEQGSYNVQLMRGTLYAGDEDTFTAVNSMPWLLLITDGEVSVGTDSYAAGDIITGTGDAVIAAESPQVTYLLASVGSKVDLPEAPDVASEGEVLVSFWDCSSLGYPVQGRDECTLIWEPVAASFTRMSQGVPLTRTDGEQLPDGFWLFEGMTTGEWQFQITTADGSTPPYFTLLADGFERDGEWLVFVPPGDRAVVDVMIYDRVPTGETGSLSLLVMECPTGWVPENDLANCWAAFTDPPISISHSGEGLTLTTEQDADLINAGNYLFDSLATGTWEIQVAYDAVWTPDSVWYLYDAYIDSASAFVDINAGAPASVLIVQSPPQSGTGVTPPTVATGYVVITQDECESWEATSPCVRAEIPWDVHFTNTETGELWMLSSGSYQREPGIWSMQLPTGSYTVDIPETHGWQLEFPGWVEILNGQESHVYIRGNQ